MMGENSFVEFWGRLSKMKEVTLGQGLQITSEDIGEEDEEGNKIDMKALAKTVDIGEMVKVLKVSCEVRKVPDSRSLTAHPSER
jgi:hypothetical protein